MFHSQYGEDALLAEIFPQRIGTCVEVGAHDGVTFSNSLHFEERGWQCVLVEPHPASCALIRARRRAKLFECAASDRTGTMQIQTAEDCPELSTVSTDLSKLQKYAATTPRAFEVQVRTLDSILDQAGISNIDFMTIDVEHHELEVLRGFSISHWLPRIVIVEDNSYGRNFAVRQYFSKNSYRPFRVTDCNIWYAHSTDACLVKEPWRLRFLSELSVAWMRRIRRLASRSNHG